MKPEFVFHITTETGKLTQPGSRTVLNLENQGRLSTLT